MDWKSNFIMIDYKKRKPVRIEKEFYNGYEFSEDFQKPVERLEEAAYPRKVEILDKRKVRSRSPGKWHMGIDARIC